VLKRTSLLVVALWMVWLCAHAGAQSGNTSLYVDDDAPLDVGPGDTRVSDPLEDGSEAHPFDSIQEAIETAEPFSRILVRQGFYQESLDFLGKPLTVVGVDINEPRDSAYPVLEGIEGNPVVRFDKGETATSVLEGFVISHGLNERASAILCDQSSPTISHCLIVGNRHRPQIPSDDPNSFRIPLDAAILCHQSEAVLRHCTITDNVGGVTLIDSPIRMEQSILWGNAHHDLLTVGTVQPMVRYSNVSGHGFGVGNLDTDPLFVQPGYWQDIITGQPSDVLSNPDVLWIPGDYHLQSESGHWLPDAQRWELDAQNSPCIDAGDPNLWTGAEMPPHGERINLGAYGGTAAASRTPPEDGAPVVFGNAAIKRAVEDTLWIPDPSPRDMLGLTELSCVFVNVQDITGLEYALNLETLILSDNFISDISVLGGLTKLDMLLLNQNEIRDFSVLHRLPQLRHLDIHHNNIHDISALATLKNLEALIIRENSIRDISPIQELKRLRQLSIRYNPVSDISPLADLTQIEQLDLWGCLIEDLSPLLQYRNIDTLYLKGNELNDVSRSEYLPAIIQNNPGADVVWDE
jgi:hypothetical protein